MKISYNWLKEYIQTDLSPQQIAELLTDCGLEVESIEKQESVKGGLQGLIVGEVKTKIKHPDADRLNLTTVDIGSGELLNIVCGAANVAEGQKVIVATEGATLYPINGESFQIKKSKIRGQVSEGMICAEDEIGLGTSHEGIIVLETSTAIGTAAADYFKIENDSVFEIGLTPNRADAASHIGVARDLCAVINSKLLENQEAVSLKLPEVNVFKTDSKKPLSIEVVVEDVMDCPRYSGVLITDVKVGDSPQWLKNKLKSIGLKSINNIVDVTNFVLHETGQPLHAFDSDIITGNKVIVKKLTAKTKFTTLDGVERELNGNELMICDAEEGMCIAGVFGGVKSGVSEKTKNIFIESAYFNPTSIQKTAKYHGLKTDASFRYERGADPNITVYALKRAALLVKEVAGGKVASQIIDVYPQPIQPFKVGFSYKNFDTIAGKEIDRSIIKNILISLGIEIASEGADALLLSVPPFKVDVKREIDVAEEILRIYGYNNIELPNRFLSALSFSQKPNKNSIQNTVADLLCNSGFNEIMTTSLTKASYYEEGNSVDILNALSTDLNVLRQNLLFSGLETIVYNQNRKNSNLKLFEFGRTYRRNDANSKWSYEEETHVALFISGKKLPENWNSTNDTVSFYTIKGYVQQIIIKLGLQGLQTEISDDELVSEGFVYKAGKKQIVKIGKVKKSILKYFDIKNEVFYADFNWDNVLNTLNVKPSFYKDLPKYPEVRRDLALLIDKHVKFEQLEQLALQTEKKLLKKISLFDIYKGDKLEAGKKSYALSFILQDENATLTDGEVDKIMGRLQKTFEEKAGAKIR